jgi:acyl carrier protein
MGFVQPIAWDGNGRIAGKIGGGQLRPDLRAADVQGWDSFKQIELIVAVERRFSIRFNSREMDGLGCVGDMVQLIARKLPATP